ALLLQLLVVQEPHVVQLLEHRLEPRTLHLLRGRAKGVRVDAELLQPLPLLLDAEAALREPERIGAEERALLHEAPVRRHECDRHSEREERDHVAVVVRDRLADDGTDDRAGEADRERQPDRHRIRPRNREARERSRDEAREQDREHEPAAHAGTSVIADRSRRSSLSSSRSLAAYSKRSSSAAWNISSSSVMTSFSSSSRDMPSTLSAPRRRRDVGTCGCSSAR